ncbi:MAG TPA: hypothetical protein V6C85_05940 [Allocoleopsis sp.]
MLPLISQRYSGSTGEAIATAQSLYVRQNPHVKAPALRVEIVEQPLQRSLFLRAASKMRRCSARAIAV